MIDFFFVYGEANKTAIIVQAVDRTNANAIFAAKGVGDYLHTEVATKCKRCNKYRRIYGFNGSYRSLELCENILH